MSSNKYTISVKAEHGEHICHHHHDAYEKKAKVVVIISFVTMVAEIIFGYITNSIALLTDGIHMGSHVLAIGLTWFAYLFIKKHKNNTQFKNSTSKILSLSGYTSAIILLVVALLMMVEAFGRVLDPESIKFNEALIVAIIGLFVNLISAKILHHDHEHSDHNIRAAYLHVLSDALTSILAIAALIVGKTYNIMWADALSGIVSSIVILKWSFGLIAQSGKKLVDYSDE
jgi:cation diffusion facilitator family transporter